MFSKPTQKIRKSTYGFLAKSIISQDGNKTGINASNGTAFMVAPGYLVTAAHSIHQESKPDKPVHHNFQVVSATDVGQQMEQAKFIAEDKRNDLALLQIENQRSNDSIQFNTEIMLRGTSCGFLGFPLAKIQWAKDGKSNYILDERFQGAYISNYVQANNPNGPDNYYEIDHLMYEGSSGCPGFTVEGEAIGMQVASIMHKQKESNEAQRVAISLVIPAHTIVDFLKSNNIKL